MITPIGPLKVEQLYEVELSYTAFCHAEKSSITARSGTVYASRISSETVSGSNLHSLKLRLWGIEETEQGTC